MSEPVCYGPWRRAADPLDVIDWLAERRREAPAGWLPALLVIAFFLGFVVGNL